VVSTLGWRRRALALAAALLVAGCTTTSDTGAEVKTLGLFPPGAKQASAALKSKSNSSVYGMITFRQSGDKVGVAATVFNLSNEPYSMYIHETGNCSSPNAASAGPVWNATNAGPGARRSGDLPGLFPGSEGNAAMQATLSGLSVGDGKPTDIVGRAVVVHRGFDRNPQPQFGGVPNNWVACGVIEQAN
jgi:Cu-Zn family superoxide dismutase